MNTTDGIETVLAEHDTVATGLGEWACRCTPREWRPTVHRAPHVAAALAAHLLSDAVVERAGRALYGPQMGGLSAEPPEYREQVFNDARAALAAAVGGDTE